MRVGISDSGERAAHPERRYFRVRLKESKLVFDEFDTKPEAVKEAKKLAQPGEVMEVASWDHSGKTWDVVETIKG